MILQTKRNVRVFAELIDLFAKLDQWLQHLLGERTLFSRKKESPVVEKKL